MKKAYTDVEQKGITMKPESTKSLTKKLADTFKAGTKNELRPERDAEVIDLLQQVRDMLGRKVTLKTVQTHPVRGTIKRNVEGFRKFNFNDIDQAARHITEVAEGLKPEQRKKAYLIRDALEEWIDGIDPSMTNATPEQFAFVQRRLGQAREARKAITRNDEITKVVSNTVDRLEKNFTMKDAARAVRDELVKLDKKFRPEEKSFNRMLANNFSKAEKDNIKKLIRPGGVQKLMEGLGRGAFTFTKADLALLMTGIFGASLGYPGALAITGAEMLAHIPRQIGNKAFLGQLSDVQRAAGGLPAISRATPAPVAAGTRAVLPPVAEEAERRFFSNQSP
jgi:hypothetical protein